MRLRCFLTPGNGSTIVITLFDSEKFFIIIFFEKNVILTLLKGVSNKFYFILFYYSNKYWVFKKFKFKRKTLHDFIFILKNA